MNIYDATVTHTPSCLECTPKCWQFVGCDAFVKGHHLAYFVLKHFYFLETKSTKWDC